MRVARHLALVVGCAVVLATTASPPAGRAAGLGSESIVSEAASAVSDLFKEGRLAAEAGHGAGGPAAPGSDLTRGMIELLEARLRAF